MTVKLLTGHHLEFLSLKGGYVGLSASTIVKMPHFGNHMSRLNYYVKGRLWDSISGFIYKPCLWTPAYGSVQGAFPVDKIIGITKYNC